MKNESLDPKNFQIDPIEQARMDERAETIGRFSELIEKYFTLIKNTSNAEKQKQMAQIYAESIALIREGVLNTLDPKIQEHGIEKVFGSVSQGELNFVMNPKGNDKSDIQEKLLRRSKKFISDNTSPANRSKLAEPTEYNGSPSFQPNEVTNFKWPEFSNDN